jgi:plastocyanin domain-containing protein
MKHKQQRKRTEPSRTLLWIGIAGIILMIGLLTYLISKLSASATPEQVNAPLGDSQEIRMAVNSREGYVPSTFTVQAGKPVRWVIEGSNSMGCAAALTSRQLGISKLIKPGTNIIEFTAPTSPGTYLFSCSMNMYRGSITVV